MATITRDTARSRLLITPDSYEEGNVLRTLPTRRWLPTKGIFVVPLTRMNARQILGAADRGMLQLIEKHGGVCSTTDSHPLRECLEQLATPPRNDRQWPNNFPFRQEPFPDQLAAVRKCYGADTFALLMRPGSGKTKAAIDLMAKHFGDGRIGLVIVVCPLTVAPVWLYNEIQKHIPREVGYSVKMFGDKRPAAESGRCPRLAWWVVGVESFSQGTLAPRLGAAIREWQERTGGQYAVLVDESHTIKTHNAVRTQRVIELGRGATVRGIMTGTAVTRSLIDLYSQFDFLDPNIIGINDWFAFRNRYCVMGGYKRREIVGYDHVEELMGLLEPYTYRCDKPRGLPPKRYDARTVQMAPEQRKVYDKVRSAEVEQIAVANILNRVAKLQQVAGGFLRSDPKEAFDPITGRKRRVPGDVIWELPATQNPKLRALRDIMEEARDQQVIVWCKHLWEIDQAMAVMAEYADVGAVAKLVGATPVQERGRIQAEFQAGTIQHLVGNQQTGGIGITLTASHLAVYYSNTYSMVDRTQSEDRQHRIGQTNDVLYLDLLMERSVDKIIKAAIQEHLDLDAYIARKLDEAQGNNSAIKDILGDVL